MITVFKIFEDLKKYKPAINGYVLINSGIKTKAGEFMDNNIGEIIGIGSSSMKVRYTNIPYKIRYAFDMGEKGCRFFNIDQIVEYAPTVEELEMKLATNKYNI